MPSALPIAAPEIVVPKKLRPDGSSVLPSAEPTLERASVAMA